MLMPTTPLSFVLQFISDAGPVESMIQIIAMVPCDAADHDYVIIWYNFRSQAM